VEAEQKYVFFVKNYVQYRDYKKHQETNCEYPKKNSNIHRTQNGSKGTRILGDFINGKEEVDENDVAVQKPVKLKTGAVEIVGTTSGKVLCPFCAQECRNFEAVQMHILTSCMATEALSATGSFNNLSNLAPQTMIPCDVCGDAYPTSAFIEHQALCSVANKGRNSQYFDSEEKLKKKGRRKSKTSMNKSSSKNNFEAPIEGGEHVVVNQMQLNTKITGIPSLLHENDINDGTKLNKKTKRNVQNCDITKTQTKVCTRE